MNFEEKSTKKCSVEFRSQSPIMRKNQSEIKYDKHNHKHFNNRGEIELEKSPSNLAIFCSESNFDSEYKSIKNKNNYL